mgnify:CR=1 FL=1
MSFLKKVSSGFDGFSQLFTPHFLRRGVQPTLISDEKSAPLDPDRSLEERGADIKHREILGNQNRKLPLDVKTISDSTGNYHRYPSLVTNDNLVA